MTELIMPLLVLILGASMAAIADWIVYAAIALTATSTVYSYQATQKAAKDQLKSGGVEITRQDNNSGLTIIYGERAVGGVKVWKDVQRTTFALSAGRTSFGQGDASDGVGKTFQLNAWLNRVDVLGQGPIQGITNIEIEDDSYQAPRFRKRNQAIYRGVLMDGSDSQGALTELASNSDWKASSVGTGVAYMYSRFRAGHFSSNKLDRYFSGEPMMRYHVKGRLVWDPRDVAQSSSDASTWLWSDNPALCLLDYLTQPYGRNLDYAQLDVESFKTAADSCDILVTVPSTLNESGSSSIYWDPELAEYVTVAVNASIPGYRTFQTGTTQKRLTCNAAIDPANTVLENVKILLQSMRGTLPYYNGKYSLKLEDVEPTSMTFTEDDIIGGLSISNGDRSKRFNRTTVIFKNRNKKYKQDRVSWPALDSAEYAALLAEDNNEELFYEVGLDAVTDYYQAEDLAEFITLSSREQLSAGMKVKSKGMLLEPGDVVEVTHVTPGWSARKFRVRSIKVNTDHTVDLSLTEYNAATYTWRDTSQEPVQEDIGLATPFDDKLPVTNVATTVTRTDTASGVPQGLVNLTFTAPEAETPREYLVRFKPTGSSVWYENVFPPLQDEVTDLVTIQFLTPQHDTTYDLEVNYIDPAGITGEPASTTFTVPLYYTDLEVDLNYIETETGIILQQEDSSGNFCMSSLSDLATFYKDTELTLQLQIDGINTTLTDLTAANATIYIQTTAPLAGVDGVPDPIEENSRWYDSDDNNHPYVFTNGAWLSLRDGQIAVNQSSISGLQTVVNDPTSGVTATSTALGVLDTTVNGISGTLSATTTQVNAIQSAIDDPATGLSATATLASTLQADVSTINGTLTATATDVSTLQSTVNDPATGVAATASVASGAATTAAANSTGIATLEAEAFLTVTNGGNISGFKASSGALGSSFTIQADQFSLVSGDEAQTTTPFAVNATSGVVSFNATVEIDGNLIVNGSVSQSELADDSVGTGEIIDNSVTADQLEISAGSGGTGERMFFNGTDNRIEIFDASNVLRVALGDLTGV